MSEIAQFDAFISYSSHDREWAEQLATALREHGKRVWFDQWELQPGDNWQNKLQDALRDTPVLVMVLSRHSVSNRWTFFELGAALAGQKRLIPVLTSDLDIAELPPYLRSIQVLREANPDAAGQRIAEALDKAALRSAA